MQAYNNTTKFKVKCFCAESTSVLKLCIVTYSTSHIVQRHHIIIYDGPNQTPARQPRKRPIESIYVHASVVSTYTNVPMKSRSRLAGKCPFHFRLMIYVYTFGYERAGLGKIGTGTGTGTGIFRVKAGLGRGSRVLRKGLGQSKEGTRLWFLKGRDREREVAS